MHTSNTLGRKRASLRIIPGGGNVAKDTGRTTPVVAPPESLGIAGRVYWFMRIGELGGAGLTTQQAADFEKLCELHELFIELTVCDLRLTAGGRINRANKPKVDRVWARLRETYAAMAALCARLGLPPLVKRNRA